MTTSSWLRVVVAVGLLSAPVWATAGVPDRAKVEQPRAAEPAGGDCARARKLGKTCELTIDAEDVDGSAPTATGTTVTGRDFSKFGTLIRLRRDFIDAIVKTADDLE